MQPRFHGANRDAEDVGNLPVFQPLIVGQDEHVPQVLGQAIHPGTDLFAAFFFDGPVRRPRMPAFERLAEAGRFAVASKYLGSIATN